jgi:hypothetical protein
VLLPIWGYLVGNVSGSYLGFDEFLRYPPVLGHITAELALYVIDRVSDVVEYE